MMMRPVNTLKHVVDNQQAIPAGSSQDVVLVQTVENAVSTAAPNCDVGSNVRSIFLNVQVVNLTDATGLLNNCYMYLFTNPGSNIPGASFPPVNEVGTSAQRKLIFHQEMAMLSDANDSIPITLFKGVLKIPRNIQTVCSSSALFDLYEVEFAHHMVQCYW